jgi:transketolase
MKAVSTQPAWQALMTHQAQIGAAHLRDLFAADPERGTRWSVEAAGLYLDYSKNRIDGETMGLLAALARDRGLPEHIAAMFRGDVINFGIREHAMCAVASGMALCGLRPFAASCFVLTDYCRGAIRLTAMMGLPVIYVWTHASIAMGEEGPTHQPVEAASPLGWDRYVGRHGAIIAMRRFGLSARVRWCKRTSASM